MWMPSPYCYLRRINLSLANTNPFYTSPQYNGLALARHTSNTIRPLIYMSNMSIRFWSVHPIIYFYQSSIINS
ncbi:hypothetical protein IEQ34_006101 [Dendrobium chrysotoxum]|uniref:Uncharacterized protein n=1 Tax=Dendrobium chrysotoxum TaxID=161865 RepID=A0AAV7HEI7_DENCH|nr:hypothetical protein IEQ34_006101 [Dendrobium chrysotoxum]